MLEKVNATTDRVYAPLSDMTGNETLVIGQLGQSLDGRIATATGESKYINCSEGMTHLHRLRALCDAVVVGIGTVLCDNPMLTVRHVVGRSPARIIVDPSGRIPRNAKVLEDDGARRILITSSDGQFKAPEGVEVVRLERGPSGKRGFHPKLIVEALNGLGLRKILVEGGSHTVSTFLAAKCLNRLHVIVAPIVLGGGKTGLAVPGIDQLEMAIRPDVDVYRIGQDYLFDCRFK